MAMVESGKKGSDFDEFVFRYRWYIGSLLTICVVLSAGYLYYKQNEMSQSKPAEVEGLNLLSEQIEEQSLRIDALEKGIKDINDGQSLSQNTIVDSGEIAGASAKSVEESVVPSGKINLNTATASQLDTLPGIGPAYASRIIEYRSSNGGFKDIAEIQNIKGIGPKTFEKIKELITI